MLESSEDAGVPGRSCAGSYGECEERERHQRHFGPLTSLPQAIVVCLPIGGRT